MNNNMHNLSFSIEGSFVTNIAREWFWDEHKPWKTIEELLFSCMCGTDLSEEQLRRYAIGIIFGQYKFVGNSNDGSYGLIKDDSDPLMPIRKIEHKLKQLEEKEEEFDSLLEKYNNLIDWLIDNDYSYLIKRAEKETGHLIISEEIKEENSMFSSMLDSFIKQTKIEEKFDNNYGWLDPRGNFYPSEWGTHEIWAQEKAEELGYVAEDDDILTFGSDKLVEHGWILLHSPSQGIPKISCGKFTKLTKAQREFLYDYYHKRNLIKEANQIIEDN